MNIVLLQHLSRYLLRFASLLTPPHLPGLLVPNLLGLQANPAPPGLLSMELLSAKSLGLPWDALPGLFPMFVIPLKLPVLLRAPNDGDSPIFVFPPSFPHSFPFPSVPFSCVPFPSSNPPLTALSMIPPPSVLVTLSSTFLSVLTFPFPPSVTSLTTT